MDPHVIVLGGGISGLSLAWRLSSLGVSVDVLEANSSVGGLARTRIEDGYYLDVGPHSFFSEDDWLVKDVMNLFDYPLEPMPRKVKFFYKNKYLDYPLTVQGVLLQMGLVSGMQAAFSYLKGRILPYRSSTLGTDEETVEDWAIANFGKHLYRCFFKPYTEQFWKVLCTELSSRTIPTHTRMSFLNTLWLLLGRGATKDGSSLIEREALPTYYPKRGFGEIADVIGRAVQAKGGRIQVDCRATEALCFEDGRVLIRYEHNNKQEEIEGSHVVSTIPLHRLFPMLRPRPPDDVLAAATRLDYRALTVLGMVTEKQNILGCGYIYLLNRPYNRIFEMNEFSTSTSPEGENILAVEFPCLYGSVVWNVSREELFEMCIGSLAEDGFLQPGDVKRLILVKDPCAYPVYRKSYARDLKSVLDYINQHERLWTLGRSGEFMYMDIDVCIKRAFALADKFVDQR